MTSENDRLRLFEVAFSYEVTGTLLVLAADPAKAKEKAAAQIEEDLDNFGDSGILWNEYEQPILKDDLHSVLTLEEPQRSTYDIHTAGREDEFDEAELALLEPGQDAEEATSSEPKQGDDKPFDENKDGVDKPGDDRRMPPRPSTPPRPQVGPAIGMTGTRDNSPPTSPQSTRHVVQPNTPPRPSTPSASRPFVTPPPVSPKKPTP